MESEKKKKKEKILKDYREFFFCQKCGTMGCRMIKIEEPLIRR